MQRWRRTVEPLYVVFHACEYPTAKTVRSLSVEVSATWQKEEVEKKAIAEAARKAKEEADKKAKEEEEKRIREAEERQARAEEKQARAEEKQARAEEKRARDEEKQARVEEKQARAEEKQTREEEKQARADEKQAREEERQARKENKSTPSIANAPDVADDNMQTVIAKKMTELNIQPCPNGYGFKKTSTGYECSGGGHKITFEQLGMK
ncbi:hypothetical protein BDQ12DRAFT_681659 [Crucibulum laeve]|uniref:Uncharacterized protein n=1 Tax=Crucibulum laeve TaxID=68775 RepID=A0A5C3M3K6_9AGAR|nr:hypothetical protein BDQ12DRAFT_681659 [Crucibulum laeve]